MDGESVEDENNNLMTPVCRRGSGKDLIKMRPSKLIEKLINNTI